MKWQWGRGVFWFLRGVSRYCYWKTEDWIACVHTKSLQPCPTLFNPWTVAHQAPLSIGFSRQEYQSGLPCPPPGDLPDSGIKPASLIFPIVGRQPTTSHLGSLRTRLKVSASHVMSNHSVVSKTFATSKSVAHQAPLSMEFFRQEYWSRLLFPSPGTSLRYAKLLQSCPTLCDPMDWSPPGFSVRGILQARVLEWVCHFLFQRD